jgi:hypothetical protein
VTPVTAIRASLAKARWALWAAIGLAAVVGLWAVRNLFSGKPHAGPSFLPPVPPKLQAKVDKVEEEALKAKVEAAVRAEESKKVLEEIAAIPDGAERRKRLAEKLRNR